jgi:hypothetical protein
MPELIMPPALSGFTAYCESCETNRTVHLSKEADTGTGEVYYEYMCDECFMILLTIKPVGSSVSS